MNRFETIAMWLALITIPLVFLYVGAVESGALDNVVGYLLAAVPVLVLIAIHLLLNLSDRQQKRRK